jgi:hypothetical protein
LRRKGTADGKRSLGVYFVSGYYRCHRCGAVGRAALGGRAVDEPDIAVPTVELGPPDGYTPLWREPGLSAETLMHARLYLDRRGVHAQTVAEAKIGACFDGPCAGRIVVPVFSQDGSAWLGWSARKWDVPRVADDMFAGAQDSVRRFGRRRSPPKYLTAEGMDRESELFNGAALLVETDVPALAVEGVFDALPYWPDVVAFLGKPSEGQIEKLSRSRRPVVVAMDGDAWIEGEMLCLRLRMDGALAGWLRLAPKTDPGCSDPEVLWRRALAAVGQ